MFADGSVTNVSHDEDLRKQFENMTFNEMSQRIAESYKQLSDILGNRISLPSTISSATDTIESEELDDTIFEREDIDLDSKRQRCTQLFLKSASSGDLEKVLHYLNTQKESIDINAKDQDGTTPLIYAACFGKYEVAQALLTAGAKVENQDAHGWTALMWATTNNHESLVKLLLDHGASSQTKSAKGRTVLDFVKEETNTNIAGILANNQMPRASISSTTSSIIGLTTAESTLSTVSRDHYYPYEENYESLLNLDNENRPKLIEEYLMTHEEQQQQQPQKTLEPEEAEECSEEIGDDEMKDVEFDWENCNPSQMFVFAVDRLSWILDTVITNISLPIRNPQDIFLPANVIFLSARFVHYFYGESDLKETLMEGALERISQTIKSHPDNVHVLSYWMTNITRLLYYLKRDGGLMTTTADYQLKLSELILETYTYLIQDTEKRLSQILEMAILDYDPNTGMAQTEFVDDWQRFFRRKSTLMERNSSQQSESDQKVVSPETLTTLLSCTLYVLQSYEVHSTIVVQAIAQFFHFMSCELFNYILTKKKNLCRSKAAQVRMNLAELEEWVRSNHLPSTLLSYLKPTVQLVQLLQCISQLDSLDTANMFDALNELQIKRCIVNYRYEMNEPKIPNTLQNTVSSSRKSIASQVRTEEEEEVLEETKDSKFMLPFRVPTATQLALMDESIVPVIPQDWMEKLDKSSS